MNRSFTIRSSRALNAKETLALKSSLAKNVSFFGFECPSFKVVVCHTKKEWRTESKYYYFEFARGLVLRDGTVVVKSRSLSNKSLRDWQKIVTHEINHSYWCHLSRRGRDLWSPLWLAEGLACTVGNNYPTRSHRALKQLIGKMDKDKNLPFRWRASLFRGPEDLKTHYSVWRAFTEWLFRRNTRGLRSLLKKLHQIRSMAHFDREMARVFGEPTKELYRDFVSSLGAA